MYMGINIIMPREKEMPKVWVESEHEVISPYHKLLHSLLIRTIMDLSLSDKRNIKDAVLWIKSHHTYPFSFEWTMEHLGISPARMRLQIIENFPEIEWY